MTETATVREGPTAEQCTAGAELVLTGLGSDGQATKTGVALWYPQMGGYGATCFVVREADCFDAFVWHDGEFPFGEGDGREPARLHHCAPEQFIAFGETVRAKLWQWQPLRAKLAAVFGDVLGVPGPGATPDIVDAVAVERLRDHRRLLDELRELNDELMNDRPAEGWGAPLVPLAVSRLRELRAEVEQLRRETSTVREPTCSCREIQRADPLRHFTGCPLREPLPEGHPLAEDTLARLCQANAELGTSVLTLRGERDDARAVARQLLDWTEQCEGWDQPDSELRLVVEGWAR